MNSDTILRADTYHQWDLEQRRQFILVLDTGPWVNHATLVVQHTVTADQHVVRNRLAKDLDLENIGNDFLGFLYNQ